MFWNWKRPNSSHEKENSVHNRLEKQLRFSSLENFKNQSHKLKAQKQLSKKITFGKPS